MGTFKNDVPIMVVGGGPVGLALALDLGWRGVPCLLVEAGDGSIVDAKMFATGIRTVEFCRRWGIAGKVRDWGFPTDFPFDNVFVTSLTGYELARIPMPSIADTPPIASSPENFAHCPQFVFDPILADAVRSMPSVELRYLCRMTEFEERDDHVVATLEDQRTGERTKIAARYLVACDGFSSGVRKALGIEMRGDAMLNRAINIMFRTPDLAAVHDKGDAGRYVPIGPEGPWASLVATDGRERWRLMIYDSAASDVTPEDAAGAVRRAVGIDFDFEVLSVGYWVRRRMVADAYGRGRAFLAGDAAHVMPPNGGLGMNTGIGDAVDLSWKLAAMIDGWGGDQLLASYDAERRPVGIRACDEAMRNWGRNTPGRRFDAIEDDSQEGAGLRAELGRQLEQSNRMAWENPLNTHLGYRYDTSPICVPDGEAPPEPADARHYNPTSHPGARAPHAWLPDGRSTLDLFGRGFVLLRFDRESRPAAAALEASAGRRGVPLETVPIPDPEIARLYERKMVLVRPDGHVAWRGDDLPDDPDRLLHTVRGAGGEAVAAG